MRTHFLKPMLALGILAAANPAIAVTKTAELGVSALVADSCTITTVTPLAFATLDTSSDANQVTPGALSVLCTSTKTAISVSLGEGTNADSSQRRMSNGSGAFIPYNVFKDAAHETSVAVDGDIYDGGVTALLPQVLFVYGKIPQGSYATGVYSDTITVTLTYE